MPILQDPRTMLGSKFDESMQYSLVPVFRVPARQAAGWKAVGDVMNNDGELMQMIARKKSRQLLEQEAKQKELLTVQQDRHKPKPNPVPRWAPTRQARMVEAKRKVLLAERGLYKCSAEELAALKLEWRGGDRGKVRMGSARKRVPRRSRDSHAPRESGAGRRLREDGGANRPSPLIPVLPKSDDS